MRFAKDPFEIFDFVGKFLMKPTSEPIVRLEIGGDSVLITLKPSWAPALEKAGGQWVTASEFPNQRHIDLIREGMTLRAYEVADE